MNKMDLDSLKPNANVYKEQQAKNKKEDRKKLQAVVKKESIVSTKKPLGQKFKEAFISEDTSDVKSYIFLDVIIPTIKNTILDVGEMILFGGTSGRSRRGGGYYSADRDRVSYRAYYKSDNRGTVRRNRREEERYEKDDKVDYRNIILRNRIDAEEVVNELRNRIDQYDQATIADLFDLIDVTSSYIDSNWGWTDMNDIGIRRVSAGYLIDLAEAKYLE